MLGFEDQDVFTPYALTAGGKNISNNRILLLVIPRQMVKKMGVKKSATGANAQIKQTKNLCDKVSSAGLTCEASRKPSSTSFCS